MNVKVNRTSFFPITLYDPDFFDRNLSKPGNIDDKQNISFWNDLAIN